MIHFECGCPFCTSKPYSEYRKEAWNFSAPRPWLLDEETVYMEIPKNGSASIKHHFLQSKQNSFEMIDPIQIINYKKVLIVLRDPIARFKSLLSHYFLKSGSHHERTAPFNSGQEWLRSRNISCTITHDNICKIVLDNIGGICTILAPHHFNLQTSFLLTKGFFNPECKTEYIRMRDINKLGVGIKKNFSGSKAIVVDPKDVERIRGLYAEDFKLYKSAFGS